MTEKKTLKVQFEEVATFLAENGAGQEMIDFINDRAEKSIRKNTSRKKLPPRNTIKKLRKLLTSILLIQGQKSSQKTL